MPSCPCNAVFAPSNQPFNDALLSGRLWKQLLVPDGAQTSDLQTIMLNHIAPGRLTGQQLQKKAGSAITMASGRQAELAITNGEPPPCPFFACHAMTRI